MPPRPASPRNRRKLKARAAAWKALKEDTYEVAVLKRIYGYNPIIGESPARPRGILNV